MSKTTDEMGNIPIILYSDDDAMLQTRDLGTKRYPPSRANEARRARWGARCRLLSPRPLKCEHEQPLLRVNFTSYPAPLGCQSSLALPSLPSDAPSAPRSKQHSTATKSERERAWPRRSASSLSSTAATRVAPRTGRKPCRYEENNQHWQQREKDSACRERG